MRSLKGLAIVLIGVLVLTGDRFKLHHLGHNIFDQIVQTVTNRTKLHLNFKPNIFSRESLKKICGSDVTVMADPQTRDHFRKVHFLVTLNTPLWKVVPLVDALYSPFFRRITYCSVPGNVTDAELLRNHGYDILTYRSPYPDIPPGWFAGYKCSVELYNRGLISKDSVGVLVMSDDMIVSIQKLKKLNLNSIWRRVANISVNLQNGHTCGENHCIDRPAQWAWWRPKYLPTYRKALQELKTRADNGEQPYRDCYRQLVRTTGGENRVFGGVTADVYYVPTKYMPKYTKLLEVFFRAKSFLEITIPTTLWCMENATETERIRGLNEWSVRHWDMFDHFLNQTDKFFCHPVKWSHLFKDEYSETDSRLQQLLCKGVVLYLSESSE